MLMILIICFLMLLRSLSAESEHAEDGDRGVRSGGGGERASDGVPGRGGGRVPRRSARALGRKGKLAFSSEEKRLEGGFSRERLFGASPPARGRGRTPRPGLARGWGSNAPENPSG